MVGTDVSAYQRGAETALSRFGVVKHAFDGDLAGFAKRLLVGEPSKYMQQLRSGELFTRKGMVAPHIDPRVPGSPALTALAAAFTYGIPAYGLYHASQTPAQTRGSTLGGAVGGLLGSTVAAPLGVVGSITGGTLGALAGESLGRVFNSDQQAEPAPKP